MATKKKTTTKKKTATKKKGTSNKKQKKVKASQAKAIVQWGSLKFRVDSKVVRSVDGFQASLKAKDKDSKCKKKYTEPEEVKFTISTSIEAGGNPIKDYNYLKSFINANDKGETKAMTLKIQEPDEVAPLGLLIPGIRISEVHRKLVNDISKSAIKITTWKGGKFKLNSVAMKDVQMDGGGVIHAARIDLSFVEVPGKKDGKWKQVKKYRGQSLVENTW